MIADYENLQDTNASEIYVKSLKHKEVFVEDPCVFPCSRGMLKLPGQPEPLVPAMSNQRKVQSTGGGVIDRHHEEPRLKQHTPDDEILRFSLKYVDAMVWMIVFAGKCSSPHQQCHGDQGASR